MDYPGCELVDVGENGNSGVVLARGRSERSVLERVVEDVAESRQARLGDVDQRSCKLSAIWSNSFTQKTRDTRHTDPVPVRLCQVPDQLKLTPDSEYRCAKFVRDMADEAELGLIALEQALSAG